MNLLFSSHNTGERGERKKREKEGEKSA